MKKKVFLGGTCNGSNWRELLIPLLKIDYFNPTVEHWTPECQQREIEERKNCDIVLYYITPKMTGMYSIAEAVDDSNKRPSKTIFCFEHQSDGVQFTPAQQKSLNMIGKMIENNGATWVHLVKDQDLADVLNSFGQSA